MGSAGLLQILRAVQSSQERNNERYYGFYDLVFSLFKLGKVNMCNKERWALYEGRNSFCCCLSSCVPVGWGALHQLDCAPLTVKGNPSLHLQNWDFLHLQMKAEPV